MGGATLLGSGLVMKLAPAFDLLSLIQTKLPIEMGLKAFNQEITSSYTSFVKVPYLKEALGYLGLSSLSFMKTLAVFDFICAMLILLPKGRRPAQIAGNWIILQMIGAEYCVRMSGVYMSSAKKLPYYDIVMSVVHAYILFEGLLCLRSDALNLSGWAWSFLPASVQKFITAGCSKITGSCKKAAETAKKVEEKTVDATKKVAETTKKVEGKVQERGRTGAAGGSSKNRSTTPGASTAKKTK